MKKLFLIDAMALIYRAHFAFSKNPRINSRGLNTSSVFGFANTLLEVLDKEKPSHIGVGFDLPGPTFRHEQFEAYKAQRQEQPEDITLAIPYIKQLLTGMDIPILEMPGFEADDIIGTIAKRAVKEGFTVYMLTPDKDYAQLVEPGIFLYRPSYLGKGYDVLGVDEVLAKFNIKRTEQVIDILGLQGDASDNIPGIPGIGEKTAQKLIEEYDSVEGVIANSDKLKGKMKENVENFAQQGLLSKHLATIHIEVDVPFRPEELVITAPKKDILQPLFVELEFRTMAKRILGEDLPGAPVQTKSAPSVSKGGQLSLFGSPEPAATETAAEVAEEEAAPVYRDTIESVPHHYHIVKDAEDLRLLGESLSGLKEFTFDTETGSLESSFTNLVGLSFAWQERVAYFVPCPPDFDKTKEILSFLKPALENPVIVKIGQNLKFDINVLARYEVAVQGPIFDTMLAHYLLHPDQRHGMDLMAENYLNYTPVSIETLIGKKGKAQGTMADADPTDLAEYAAEDSDITYQLKKVLAPQIEELSQESLLTDVEGKLIYVLSDMERSGIRIDTEALSGLSVDLAEQIIQIEAEVYQSAGEKFNMSSPQQLGKILFEKLNLDPKAKKTKTGQWATGEEVLSRLVDEHPIVSQILEFREMQKLKSTYIDSLPTLIGPDGRVHTSFNQAVAATGRLSSTNPNLQNIPIRTARGREIRKAFVARDGDYQILSADYSQVELRLMAHFSEDATMIEAFKQGKDIHAITASRIFKVDLDQVDSDMRRKAKTANFGIIYGISAFGLSQRLSIPRKEAADLIEAYFTEFSSVKKYMDRIIHLAQEQEYVSTILGRRRYLPDINSRNQTQRGFAERNAINAPIQGSAADIIKLAMINLHDWMKKENLKSKMVLQVHDELVFDAHRSEIDLLKEKVPFFMSGAIPMTVPLEVGVGVGENWFEAH
ncbi:MAG TPA: DNA polymerase I [Catalimonadaceae bacterium]|nr:DNA polymerase I [Catalimonadaceae bacterium]